MNNPIALWNILALSAAVTIGGCGPGGSEPSGQSPGTPEPLADSADEHAEHLHPTEGPHGGHLYEIGNEQYYAEMLRDESTHTVTVHLLDATAKRAVTTTVEEILLHFFLDGEYATYSLQAVNTDNTGASQFAVISERLCRLMDHYKKVRGRMHVKVGDESFIVAIEHDAHEHDGHEHDGDEHHDHGDGDDHDHDAADHR